MKKSDKKDYILDDSFCLTFQKGQIVEIKRTLVVVMEQGGERWEEGRILTTKKKLFFWGQKCSMFGLRWLLQTIYIRQSTCKVYTLNE